jgi:hypothetical protein
VVAIVTGGSRLIQSPVQIGLILDPRWKCIEQRRQCHSFAALGEVLRHLERNQAPQDYPSQAFEFYDADKITQMIASAQPDKKRQRDAEGRGRRDAPWMRRNVFDATWRV